MPLLDRLANAGHRLHAVPCVEAGRVEQVRVPRTFRETLGRRERTLGLKQPLVDRLQRGGAGASRLCHAAAINPL